MTPAAELRALVRRIADLSERLRAADGTNSSVRRRAMMRAKLATLCEARDRLQNRLQGVGELFGASEPVAPPQVRLRASAIEVPTTLDGLYRVVVRPLCESGAVVEYVALDAQARIVARARRLYEVRESLALLSPETPRIER